MDRVAGKVVLISGGAQGIGAACARVLADEGAHVVIGDALEDEGTRSQAYSAKPAASPHWTSLIRRVGQPPYQTVARCGGLDALVNNAGVLSTHPQNGNGHRVASHHRRQSTRTLPLNAGRCPYHA